MKKLLPFLILLVMANKGNAQCSKYVAFEEDVNQPLCREVIPSFGEVYSTGLFRLTNNTDDTEIFIAGFMTDGGTPGFYLKFYPDNHIGSYSPSISFGKEIDGTTGIIGGNFTVFNGIGRFTIALSWVRLFIIERISKVELHHLRDDTKKVKVRKLDKAEDFRLRLRKLWDN